MFIIIFVILGILALIFGLWPLIGVLVLTWIAWAILVTLRDY